MLKISKKIKKNLAFFVKSFIKVLKYMKFNGIIITTKAEEIG